ncbi:39S ribosomal protein L55, mitochondrial-like [Dendronephthya gigantea]|uniref:39S ribosomal protein L55, mitochondrial-like n=1 Tax=Dendronephthya gigantea TaxID=151771 RepID=UPI00106BA3BA|nr:39S ribosomal protein L55, mitochondrial-like [Dendronephthya gigantea]
MSLNMLSVLSSKIHFFRNLISRQWLLQPYHCTPLLRCSTSITRTKKSVYPRVYKVRLQQADGSSYTIRYHEPRELIRLPVDPNNLTEEEKQARLNRLKPEKEIEVHEFDDEETEIIQRSWKDFVASR